MKIYFYRHQAGGLLSQYPLSAPPSEDDLAALRQLMRVRHGTHHPKTKTLYWEKIVELECIDRGQLSKLLKEQATAAEAGAKAGAAEASLQSVSVSGTGTVEVK